MGDEARQVVVVDLIGESMLRCDKDIGKKTWFGRRNVCEPTTHDELAGDRSRLCGFIDMYGSSR